MTSGLAASGNEMNIWWGS